MPSAFAIDWDYHFQATTVTQSDTANALPPYEETGANGFSGDSQTRTSLTSTLSLGAKFRSTELYLDPELTGGRGLSDAHGIAAFPNGEIYRVGNPDPALSVARLYVKQTWSLGGDAFERVESQQNQIATEYSVNRLTLVLGKFSLNDFFDTNRYAHDPRTQFLNWSLMDNGAWDYAADTKGYTWGFMLEWNSDRFAVRLASVLEPIAPNSMEFDQDVLNSHADNLELEYRYAIETQPGRLRLLGYLNHAEMGNYQVALNRTGFKTIDVDSNRAHSVKYGLGINVEQAINERWGSFARLGWNDGQTESWAFTEVDLTASMGVVYQPFAQRDDRVGLALVANGLSAQHRRYLEAGGKGFMLGEGGLDYGLEEVAEIYYSLPVCKEFSVSADYQVIGNAGYNIDRSAISVFSLRLHAEL